MQKIISLLILLVLFSVGVVAETFELPGCSGVATVGINAVDPLGVFGPGCVRESERVLKCDCNNSIELYDKKHIMSYDFHIDYYDGDVKKNKEFYDVKLYKTYLNSKDIGLVVYFFVGILIVPILIIMFFLFISKKILSGDKK